MRYIRVATPDDKEEWNKVALESHNATYAHTWEWKEILEKEFGVESLHLLAEDKGEIVGIYPGFLSPLKTKFLKKFKVFYSPFNLTWDYGGPCTLPNVDPKVLEELVISMEKFASKKDAISLRVSPFEGDALKNIFISHNYRVSPRLTSIIDLSKSKEELWRSIQKRTRKYTTKAEKSGVSMIECKDENSLRDAYKAIFNLHTRKNAFLPPYSFFELLYNILKPKKMIRVRTANIDNKVIGGDILLCFKDTVVERYRGVYSESLNLKPYHIMVWTAIEESKEQGYKYYDLGTMPPDKDSGIYFFKSKWGGEIKNVDWYIKDVKFGMGRTLIRSIKNILRK